MTGIGWVDGVFQICVFILVDLANFLGISYEEINVWIFVVIWPLITIYQTMRILYLKSKMKLLFDGKNQ